MDRSAQLVTYIESLPNFHLVTPTLDNHMGAIIIDAVLQAGIRYQTVKKRVCELKENYPDSNTTSGFAAVIARIGTANLLRWRNGRKTTTVEKLTELFLNRNIDTADELRAWLRDDDIGSSEILQKVHGIGPKTADYLKILVGLQKVAIDSRLMHFLKDAKVSHSGYDDAALVIAQAAVLMNVDLSVLDHSIWGYRSIPGSSCAIAPAG